MELALRRDDGGTFNPWQEMGVPFLSLHGDSPAYFFDRHVVRDSLFVSLYGFTEHAELRRRLPHLRGLVETLWPAVLDEVPLHTVDFKARRNGPLLFLKNGKDPACLRRLWAECLEPWLLHAMQEMASELESDLDDPAGSQIDDLVTCYFAEAGFDIDRLLRPGIRSRASDGLAALKRFLSPQACMVSGLLWSGSRSIAEHVY